MNKLLSCLTQKSKDLLAVYFTAGYPQLNDTTSIIESLNMVGVDIIEVGMPYSDPLADGQTIQESSMKSLSNGMNIKTLFQQLKNVNSNAPLILMGYFNQFLQYGPPLFCEHAQKSGVSGVIFPDMPLDVYEKDYQALMETHDLIAIFLITPHTSIERIKRINYLSKGFIYVVSTSSTTGGALTETTETFQYFERLKNLQLSNKLLVGFGVSNRQSYQFACDHLHGAIIGSAYIKALGKSSIEADTQEFIKSIRS